ncbi:hypothetical protein, partial [Klebsiella variicola]|uniref:hypothetical protein n=1 Tax=Klebsiella variicola TaxID=244366 RepID=UPI001C3FF6C9
ADFIMVRDKEIPSETGYMAAPTRFITELKKALHSGSVHIRCLGPTRSLQGKVEGTTQWRFCWPEPGGTGGGGDWPPPVRSLRHE